MFLSASSATSRAILVAVHLVHPALQADGRQLVLARIEGERLEHVDARAHELPVQLRQRLRARQANLRDERAGLNVAAPLQLE
jgi:hypothetical protein